MSAASSLLGRYYDELAVGDRMASHGRTVTETDIVMWCTLTGDIPIHLEAEVIAKEDRKAGRAGVVTLQWNAANHNGRTVMSSQLKCLMACRPILRDASSAHFSG